MTETARADKRRIKTLQEAMNTAQRATTSGSKEELELKVLSLSFHCSSIHTQSVCVLRAAFVMWLGTGECVGS